MAFPSRSVQTAAMRCSSTWSEGVRGQRGLADLLEPAVDARPVGEAPEPFGPSHSMSGSATSGADAALRPQAARARARSARRPAVPAGLRVERTEPEGRAVLPDLRAPVPAGPRLDAARRARAVGHLRGHLPRLFTGLVRLVGLASDAL